MSGRLDWEKARRREKHRSPSAKRRDAWRARSHARDVAMFEFVKEHGLACFKCKRTDAPWAKTGVSRRGPWAICKDCVDDKR